MDGPLLKELVWIETSRKDMKPLPVAVKRIFGQALHTAHAGEKHPHTKPLKGLGGAGVLELVEDRRSDTYQGVLHRQVR
jgi:phage-related protein